MRSKFTMQQKFDMIMECHSSGLSDYMWCKEHDIRSSTFKKSCIFMFICYD